VPIKGGCRRRGRNAERMTVGKPKKKKKKISSPIWVNSAITGSTVAMVFLLWCWVGVGGQPKKKSRGKVFENRVHAFGYRGELGIGLEKRRRMDHYRVSRTRLLGRGEI